MEETLQLLHDSPSSLNLWSTIIAFEGSTFTTSGRGSRPGTRFIYSIPRQPGSSGKHYKGESVDGWGNEMFITTLDEEGRAREKKEKSISRSTVDYALNIVLEKQKAGEVITGPRELKVYGKSYVYALFKRFGLIKPISSLRHTQPRQD